jgi:flagellar biogenesis protein FliO
MEVLKLVDLNLIKRIIAKRRNNNIVKLMGWLIKVIAFTIVINWIIIKLKFKSK